MPNTAVHKSIENAKSRVRVPMRIERLPTELIDSILRRRSFSQPLSGWCLTYSALLGYGEAPWPSKLDPHCLSLRKRIETSWEPALDFDHTRTCRRTFDKNCSAWFSLKSNRRLSSAYLLTWSSNNPSVCRDGQTHLLQLRLKNLILIKRIMSAMEPRGFGHKWRYTYYQGCPVTGVLETPRSTPEI